MEFDEKLPSQLQDALNKGLLNRLPLTFLPVTRQQLREWNYLFPYERQSILHLLLYLASLSESQAAALFQDVVQLEEKMGVRNWRFSTDEQTILNASLLARSPYYQDWRKAVQKVFDTADQYAERAMARSVGGNRLVVLVLPARLPLDSSKVWQRWRGMGQAVRLDLTVAGESLSPAEALLCPAEGENRGLMDVLSKRYEASPSDAWVV